MRTPTIRPRRVLSALGGFIIATSISGCSGLVLDACPAVAYGSTLYVQLVGDASQIREVRLCDLDGNCSQFDDDSQPFRTDPPLKVVDPSDYTPAPSTEALPPYIARGGGNSWSLDMLLDRADRGTITAYNTDGTVAAEVTTEWEWTRIDGSAKCGGTTEAGPVILNLG
jgi:hypothetical protein